MFMMWSNIYSSYVVSVLEVKMLNFDMLRQQWQSAVATNLFLIYKLYIMSSTTRLTNEYQLESIHAISAKWRCRTNLVIFCFWLEVTLILLNQFCWQFSETPECKIFFTSDGTKPNPFQRKVAGREVTFKYIGPFTLKPGKRTIKVVAVSRWVHLNY